MKKRVLTIIMALAIGISLVGCTQPAVEESKKPIEEVQESEKPQESANVEEKEEEARLLAEGIKEKYSETFTANVVVDEEIIKNQYPGLSEVEVEDMVVYQPVMSSVVCEVAIVKITNTDEIEQLRKVFEDRIAYQVGDGENPGNAWYPESIEAWKNSCEIVENGKYMMLIAWDTTEDELQGAIQTFNEQVNKIREGEGE